MDHPANTGSESLPSDKQLTDSIVPPDMKALLDSLSAELGSGEANLPESSEKFSYEDARNGLQSKDPEVVSLLNLTIRKQAAAASTAGLTQAVVEPPTQQLRDVLEVLIDSLRIPPKLAEILAPLPLLELPMPTLSLSNLSETGALTKCKFPNVALSLLPLPSLPTAQMAIPQNLAHESRAPEAFLYARGWRGPKSACHPTFGHDRPGCSYITGMERWLEQTSQTLQILLSCMEVFEHDSATWMMRDVSLSTLSGKDEKSLALTQLITTIAPYASYAPWSTPEIHDVASRVLGKALSTVSDERSFWLRHLLPWTRNITKGGQWKDPRVITARYAIGWLLVHVPAHLLTADVLGDIIPTVFRFADDVETTNGYIAASVLQHIIATCSCLSEHLKAHRLILLEIVQRLTSTCKHPTVMAITAAIAPLLLYQTRTRAAEEDGDDDGVGVLHNHVKSVLSDSLLQPTAEHKMACCVGLPLAMLLLGRGTAVHVADIVAAIADAATRVASPSFCVFSLHVLCVAVHVCADRFVVTEADERLMASHGDAITPWDCVEEAKKDVSLGMHCADVASKLQLLNDVAKVCFCIAEFDASGLYADKGYKQGDLDELCVSVLDKICSVSVNTEIYMERAISTIVHRSRRMTDESKTSGNDETTT